MSAANQNSETPVSLVSDSPVPQASGAEPPMNPDPQSPRQRAGFRQPGDPPRRHTTWDYYPAGQQEAKETPYIPPLAFHPAPWAPHPFTGDAHIDPGPSTFNTWTRPPAKMEKSGSYPAPPVIPQPTGYHNPWFAQNQAQGKSTPAQPHHVAFASSAPQYAPPVSTQTANLPFVRLRVPAESEMDSQQPAPALLNQYYSGTYLSRPETPPFYRRPPKKKLTYDDIPLVPDDDLGWSTAPHTSYVPHYVPPTSPGYSPVSPAYSPTLPRPAGGYGAPPSGTPATAPAWTYPTHVPVIPQQTLNAEAVTTTTFNIVLSSLLRLTYPLAKVIYTPLLLNIPSLYRSRVFKVFLEADLGLAQLRNMVVKLASRGKLNKALMLQVGVGMGAEAFNTQGLSGYPQYSGRPTKLAQSPWQQSLPPEYEELQKTWNGFIDSLLEEWKTLGVISALVLSAILTLLQIEDAASDYVTRYIALLSLVCALVSLVYGCIYIVRFGTMRKPHKAAEWALEAQQRTTDPWWNAWIMLAMPAVWQTWSLILFITSIMTYIWRTSVIIPDTVHAPSDGALLGLRILLSSFLLLGIVQGLAIVKTLMRYGSAMDRSWEDKINKLILETALPTHGGLGLGLSRGTNLRQSKNQPYMPPTGPTYSRPPQWRDTEYPPRKPSPPQPPHWFPWSPDATKKDLIGGYPVFEDDQGPSSQVLPPMTYESSGTTSLSPSTEARRRRKKKREETRKQKHVESSDPDEEPAIRRTTLEDPGLSYSDDLRRQTRRSSGERLDYGGQGIDEERRAGASGFDASKQAERRMEGSSATFDIDPLRRPSVGSPSS